MQAPVRRFLVSCAALALVAAVDPATARPFTLDDLTAFVRIVTLDVTPDGGRVVACVERRLPDENRLATDLVLAVADGGAPERPLTSAPGDDCEPRFSPDGRRIGFLSDRSGTSQVWILPADGGEAIPATRHGEPVETFSWSADGRSILFTAAAPRAAEDQARRDRGDDAFVHGGQWRPHRLWIVAAARGDTAISGAPVPHAAPRPLTPAAFHVVDRPAPSPDGRRVAFVAQPTPEADAAEEATLQVLDLSDGTSIEVPGSERALAPAWGRAGSAGTLFFTRPFDGAGWSRADLHSWRPGESAPRNRSARLDRDVEAIDIGADGGIEVAVSRGAVTAIARLDGDRMTTAWAPAFPVAWPARTASGRLFVRLDRPHEIWRSGGRQGERPITRLNAARAAAIDLPRMETVRFTSGPWEVEGILTLPAAGGAASGRAPLLVRPHGGPRSHSLLEWSAQNAWFAALGYLVLEPNFRGSTGYGDAFAKANAGDWGRGPFADVMAGVDALVAAGRADPDRLFLYGWSYGGILANWAAGHGDRFRGIVSGAGVADLRMQYVLSDARRWRFDYFGGSPFLPRHLPVYWENSPVTGVGKVATPVLFIQGEEDRRCPLPQALMMHRAILDAGGSSELVVYPREGHLFREPAHLHDRARRIAAFLAAHGGAPIPASAGTER